LRRLRPRTRGSAAGSENRVVLALGAGDSRAEFSCAQANSGRDKQARFLAAKRAYLPKMVPVPCPVVKEGPETSPLR
jgi:hypothetical protein